MGMLVAAAEHVAQGEQQQHHHQLRAGSSLNEAMQPPSHAVAQLLAKNKELQERVHKLEAVQAMQIERQQMEEQQQQQQQEEIVRLRRGGGPGGEQVAELEARLAKQQEAAGVAQAELERLRREVEQEPWRAEMKGLRVELASLKAKHRVEKGVATPTGEELEAKVKGLEATVVTLQAQLEAWKELRQQQRDQEHEELQGEHANATAFNRGKGQVRRIVIQRELQGQVEELNRLKGIVEELMTQRDRLTSQIEDLCCDLQDLKHKRRKFEGKG